MKKSCSKCEGWAPCKWCGTKSPKSWELPFFIAIVVAGIIIETLVIIRL